MTYRCGPSNIINFQKIRNMLNVLKVHCRTFGTMFIKGVAVTLLLFVFVNYQLNVNLIRRETPQFKKILLWTTFFNDRTFGLRYS